MLGPTFDYTHRLLDPADRRAARCRRAGTRARPTPNRRRASPTCSADEGLIEPDGDTDPDRRGRRSDARAAGVPARPRPAAAGAGPRRRGLPARARLFDPARLWPHRIPSSAKSASARSRSNSTSPNSALPSPSAASASPSARWSTSSRASPKVPPQFTRGYGLVFGQAERKAMAMSLVDRALRARELGEDIVAPAQDEEFVISPLRQRAGDRLRRAPEAAALRRFPGRART